MRYAEKVMLHNLVQQTMAEKKAYNELSDSADTRLWFMGKQRIQGVLTDVIERYAFEYDVIHNLAVRERNELRTKNNAEEEAIRLYNIQADLLDEVVEIKCRMIKTLKSIRHSISLMKSFSKEDITCLIGLTDQFVPKLRDLSDVAELLEKYDVPFYKNFYKSK
jgi:hypothetical protein